MIVKLIQRILLFVVNKIFSIIDIPDLPDFLLEFLDIVLEIMKQGIAIINVFCPIENISLAIDFFIAIWVCRISYGMVMWVLKKIPMLGIE